MIFCIIHGILENLTRFCNEFKVKLANEIYKFRVTNFIRKVFEVMKFTSSE